MDFMVVSAAVSFRSPRSFLFLERLGSRAMLGLCEKKAQCVAENFPAKKSVCFFWLAMPGLLAGALVVWASFTVVLRL